MRGASAAARCLWACVGASGVVEAGWEVLGRLGCAGVLVAFGGAAGATGHGGVGVLSSGCGAGLRMSAGW